MTVVVNGVKRKRRFRIDEQRVLQHIVSLVKLWCMFSSFDFIHSLFNQLTLSDYNIYVVIYRILYQALHNFNF